MARVFSIQINKYGQIKWNWKNKSQSVNWFLGQYNLEDLTWIERMIFVTDLHCKYK